MMNVFVSLFVMKTKYYCGWGGGYSTDTSFRQKCLPTLLLKW